MINRSRVVASRGSAALSRVLRAPRPASLRTIDVFSSTASPPQRSVVHVSCVRRWFSDEKAKGTTQEAAEEPPASAEAAEEKSTAEAAKESKEAAEEKSTAEVVEESKEEQLVAQVKGLKDQLLRSLAEQENTRRIAQRDIEQARQFAIKSFAKSLLETSDNLERALAAVPEGMGKNKEEHPVLVNLYEGIEMTEKGLMKAFESNGLVKFGKPGEAFDANKHEALFEYADPEMEPGKVGQVMKYGFMLNNRVLRPAEVGIVKKQ